MEVLTVGKVDKPWGQTRPIYVGPATTVHEARIEAGGFSSRHHHVDSYNEFYVSSGQLLVWLYHGPADEGRPVLLRQGQKLVVPPRQWHRFVALTDVVLLETYWLDHIRCDDIVRHDAGGKGAVPPCPNAFPPGP